MVVKGIPHRWWEFWKYGKTGNFYGPLDEGRHIMHECHDRNCPGLDSSGNPGREQLREMGEDSADTMNEATNGQLTGQERTLLNINATVWNGFGELPKQYGNDMYDLRRHIDEINNIILARAASRANPDVVRKFPHQT